MWNSQCLAEKGGPERGSRDIRQETSSLEQGIGDLEQKNLICDKGQVMFVPDKEKFVLKQELFTTSLLDPEIGHLFKTKVRNER